MSATIWSKFFWADWLSDAELRRCSPAARGLWMDMLCLAAQAEPQGYLAKDGEPLEPKRIARNASMSEKEAVRLIAELEGEGVFSRDARGRIYSRRMVREARFVKQARKSGLRGGNPTLCRTKEISRTLKGRDKAPLTAPVHPISQSPDARLHAPAVVQSGPQASRFLIERAAAALKTPIERLMRKPAWLVFGDMVGELAAQGCEAERDVWPTIARIASRMAEPPASPAYFRQAILEARDERLARGPSRTAASGLEWEDRLAVFAAEGAWSSRWGPKPGEAGCVAPMSDDR